MIDIGIPLLIQFIYPSLDSTQEVRLLWGKTAQRCIEGGVGYPEDVQTQVSIGYFATTGDEC